MTGSIHWPTAVLVAGTMLLLWLAVWLLRRSRRRGFLSEVDRATYATLHTASLASQYLGDGLTPDAAEKAGRHLLSILGAHAVSIADPGSVLSWTGLGDHHRAHRPRPRRADPRDRAHRRARRPDVACADPDCPIRSAVTAPLVMDDLVVGTLTAWTTDPSPGPGPRHRGGGRLGVEPAGPGRARPHPHPGRWRPSCGRCAPRSAPTSSTTASRRSRRSCAPTPTGPASCSSTSPTSPATRCAPAGPFTDARRGAAQRRALPRARAGPVRRPPPDLAAHRARGAAGDACPTSRCSRSSRTPCATGWPPRRASAT